MATRAPGVTPDRVPRSSSMKSPVPPMRRSSSPNITRPSDEKSSVAGRHVALGVGGTTGAANGSR